MEMKDYRSTYLVMIGDKVVGRCKANDTLDAKDFATWLCRQRCYFSVEVFVTIRGNPYCAATPDDEIDAFVRAKYKDEGAEPSMVWNLY